MKKGFLNLASVLFSLVIVIYLASECFAGAIMIGPNNEGWMPEEQYIYLIPEPIENENQPKSGCGIGIDGNYPVVFYHNKDYKLTIGATHNDNDTSFLIDAGGFSWVSPDKYTKTIVGISIISFIDNKPATGGIYIGLERFLNDGMFLNGKINLLCFGNKGNYFIPAIGGGMVLF